MITKEAVKKALSPFGITEFAVIPADKAVLLKGKTLPSGLKTCIVFLIPYNTGEKINDKYNMGRFARSLDYHSFAKDVGEKASETLKQYSADCGFYVFCDNSPINEKQTAVAAGLGIQGKNSLLINKRFGSYCFISEIFTDSDAEEYIPVSSAALCSDCRACASACPVGAIRGDGFFKEECLSFISQKKKKTEEEMALLKKHNTVWGCDICQQICPVNKTAEKSVLEYFKRDFISDLKPETLTGMSDEEY